MYFERSRPKVQQENLAMRRIVSVLLENEPGALSRVIGLFSQRGYNIETLNVAPTEDPTLSRLTLTTIGDDKTIEQITKQLNKLVDVVKLVDLTDGSHLERDLMLVKIRTGSEQREEITQETRPWKAAIRNHQRKMRKGLISF